MILKVVHKLSRVPFTLFPEPPYVIRVISRIPRGEIRGIRGTTRVKYSTDSAKKKHGSVFVLLRDAPALRHVYRCTANALAGSLQAAQAMLTAAVAAQEKATAAVEKQAAY